MDDNTPRMKTTKQMYEDMLTEPTRPSAGHTTKPMKLADKMFAPEKKARGGAVRGWGKARSARAAKVY